MISAPMRLATITAALFLFVVACEKKTSTPKATPEATPAQKVPVSTAPKGIPAEFKALFDKHWPDVKKLGAQFEESFDEAKAAKAANDREKMDKAVTEAKKAYTALQDKWAEVVYWPQNNLENDPKLQDKCDRWISKYEHKIKAWNKKAKGLKEFSRVK